MRRIVCAGLVATLLSTAIAQAREPRQDMIPDAETAKAVGKAVLYGRVGAASFEERWSRYFISAELEGKNWVVLFSPREATPETKAKAEQPAPLRVLPDGREEVVLNYHCGFCMVIEIARRDGRIRKIYGQR